MAMERGLAICFPFIHRVRVTLRRVRIAIGIVWLLSIIIIASEIPITIVEDGVLAQDYPLSIKFEEALLYVNIGLFIVVSLLYVATFIGAIYKIRHGPSASNQTSTQV